MLDLVGHGKVITIGVLDVNQVREHYLRYVPELSPSLRIRPQHPRIKQLLESSTDRMIVADVARSVPDRGAVMVIADSDHSLDHAYAESNTYHAFATPRSYFYYGGHKYTGSGAVPSGRQLLGWAF
jgi:cephalosporin hydroxylase